MGASKPRRYLFTGGGTGGHVAPALAIAEAVRERHPEARFLYVGVAGKAEATMVPRAWKEDIEAGRASLRFVRSRGYPGLRDPVAFGRFCLALGLGTLKALLLLLVFRPHGIVASGGYVAAPALFAAVALRRARLLKTAILLHEQNAVPGRLNRLAARFADCVGLAFPGTKVAAARVAYVGYPVRRSVTRSLAQADGSSRQVAREALGLPQDARVVFAFGGSQGARTLNRALTAALPALLADPRLHVVHGTGKRLAGNRYDGAADVERVLSGLEGLPEGWRDRVRHQDFIHDMGTTYAASDLVICRGGAGSLNEVSANGVPAIVIPKANLPGDHQAFNARVLERMGGARVLYERIDLEGEEAVEVVDPALLAETVRELLDDPSGRASMTDQAAALVRSDTTAKTALLLDSLDGTAEAPVLAEPPALPEERLLGLTSAGLERVLGTVERGEETLSPDERAIALYKIDGYLAGAGYVQPARGCRMVGRGGFTERLEVLLTFATARDASGTHRHLPIVRRDALLGLGLLGALDESVVQALVAGLSDPYFEARAEAARAVTALARTRDTPAAFQELVAPLVQASADRSFETRLSALLALGEIGTSADEVLAALRARAFDSNWRVRQALFDALSRLLERGVVTADVAQAEGDAVLRTSDGYRPTFMLKESFNGLRQRTEAHR